MPDVGVTLASWSATDNSNNPQGTTAIATSLDDNLRTIQGVTVRGLSHKGSDIASSTAPALGATEGLMHDITGTSTITGFDTVRVGIWKILKFEGILTLTHNATNLILPGAANITTADGDIAIFFSEGSGNWRCVTYFPASGSLPFVDSSVVVIGSSDKTKKVRIEADGITTATTRVWTAPDKDITVAGIVDFTGANGASMVMLQSQTATNAATVDFVTGISSTYDTYVLTMSKVIPGTDATDLWIRASINGGGAYLTTNAYTHGRQTLDSSGAPTGAGSAGTADQIVAKGSLGSSANEVLNCTVTLQNLADTVVYKSVHGQGHSLDSAPVFGVFFFGGQINTTSAVNAIRVMMSSGNINGVFTLYGMRKA